MKKKVLALVLTLSMLLSFLPASMITVSAEEVASGSCGDNLTWTLDSEGTLTISGTGNMGNWSSSADGPWYSYSESIYNVVIDDGVTNIGYSAFSSCNRLTNITIPDSVTSIGGHAFYDCTGLTEITIPDSVTWIGNRAFRYCSRLTEVTIPSNVTSIGTELFSKCRSLTEINVDSNNPAYVSVDGVLFDKTKTTLIRYPGGKTETTYEIPKSVNKIENGAFDSCRGLTSITIPRSVVSIGDYSFDGCGKLTDVYYGGTEEAWNAITIDSHDEELTNATIHYTEITLEEKVATDKDALDLGDLSAVTENITLPTIGSVYGFAITWATSDASVIEADGTVHRTTEDKTATLTATITSGEVSDTKEFGVIVAALDEIANGTCGDNLTWTLDEEGTLTISGTGDMEDWVKALDMPWYSYRYSISQAIIEDDVTSIGDRAFVDCNRITEITIPTSVTSIGKYALNCDNLTVINVDSNNPTYTSVDGVLFNKNRTGLIRYPKGKTETTYEIPNGVTKIEDGAFSGCSKLTSITIPVSVTDIGNMVLDRCSGLTEINVDSNNPAYVSVDGVLFSADKTELIRYPGGKTETTYEIPESVNKIANGTFDSCSNFTSINIPDNVNSIGKWAFSVCRGLTSITIPDSVASIGECAFAYCSGLTSITIPNKITRIEFSTFMGCTNLAEITIPYSATYIENGAFSSCKNLTDVYYTGTEEMWNKLYKGSNNDYLTNATIHYAELNADIIEPGTCGENLTWKLDIEGTLTISGTGDMYDWDGISDVPWYSYKYSIRNVIIEDGVTSIGNDAFYNCSEITIITIPVSVTSIDSYVFERCSGLTEINVDSNNPAYTSVDGVLFNKDETEILCYPIGKTETTYEIPYGVTGIGNRAFYFCDSLESITIPDSVTSIGIFAFRDCSSLVSIILPNGVTSIGESAFEYCSSLIEINVDSNNPAYTSVDGVLFNKDETEILCYPCGKIETTYEIPEGVTGIGDGVFSDCNKLTSITIPASVTNIGNRAFFGCGGLASITIPSSVTSIGYGAFFGCRGLTSITIPDSVTNIGIMTFSACSGLREATIPRSVTSIGNYAFNNCNNLTDVYYGGTEDEWNSITRGEYNECLTDATIHYTELTVGDANGDGEVDFADAIAVLKHDAGISTLTDDKLTAVDVNSDGEVDFVDAMQILKYDSGLISTF